MIEDHGRYTYSSIDSRPIYDWPGKKRLAVYMAMNIEVFRYGKGKSGGIVPPDRPTVPSVYSFRDYGNRVGFWRLMDLFDKLDLPLEHQINTAIYDHCPGIMERIRARKDEILGHGITNSDEQGNLPEEEERKLIEHCASVIEKHEGVRPTGWMSPWISNSEKTLDILQEAGYRYMMDWTMDDQPIWAKTRSGRILLMPYPIENNDHRALYWYHYSSADYADMIIDAFDEMLEQSKDRPLVYPISLHPFVVGRPYRIRQLRRALEHVASKRDKIWLTRPGNICRHIESLPKGVVPGDNF